MSESRLIAIVEDEKDIADLIALHLGKAGYETRVFPDGEAFLFAARSRAPDLVILDLMLPGLDGLEVCRNLKAEPATKGIPVVMVTAKGTETDRVVGLELGADDYLVKPFSPRELVARVKAVLRRSEDRLQRHEVIRLGRLVIDPDRCEVTVKGRPVEMTATELRILELLASQPDRVFSRNQIIEHAWGYDKPVTDRTIDVHVSNLREKLGPLGERIGSVRGIGYKFRADPK
jgi:DNA-binding response OmpR family regulator